MKVGKYELNIEACLAMGEPMFLKAFRHKFDAESLWAEIAPKEKEEKEDFKEVVKKLKKK